MNTVTNASTAFGKVPDTSPPDETTTIGWWYPVQGKQPEFMGSVDAALRPLNKPVYLVDNNGKPAYCNEGAISLGGARADGEAWPLLAALPPLPARHLGDSEFCREFGLRLPYMAGSMANGIASTELVIAICRAGMLASFGAAGLSIAEISQALKTLRRALPDQTWASNLIHAPNEKGHEDAVVDLYLSEDIQLVEASAYLKLTPAVVRYRVHGIHRDAAGHIVTPNHIIAKASRIEVARHWFSPPPQPMLQELLDRGDINAEQAELAAQVPMAQDLTVEADSGGHTDNRPAITLIPTIIALRDRLQAQYQYAAPLRVGAAGGIATPVSAAAAFAMGVAYIVTGTVNQACRESGSSDTVRKMLAEAEQADVTMAPAVDMFEMGVKLQVLKRGTMFAMRGNKLYETYRQYNSLEDIPAAERQSLEESIFKASLDTVWEETRRFFLERNPAEIERAEQDPRHRMALVFRWYLGLSSRWANSGKEGRQVDYQIWCGPAMGAFNEWVKGSRLEQPEHREVVNVALNLMYGAARVSRLNQLRYQGINLPGNAIDLAPQESNDIEVHLSD